MSRKGSKPPPPKFSTSGTWHTHFTPFFDDQIDSKAYIALSASAKEVYTILRRQYKGDYTGEVIKCPYSTFERYRIRRETVARSIDQLEAFGFISVDRGGLAHQPSKYHLINKWQELEDPKKFREAKAELEERKRRAKLAKEKAREYSIQHAN